MKINVPHIAKLANLTVSYNEESNLEKQLEETLDYVEELNKVNTNNIEPTSQVTGLENVTRGDTVKPSLTQDEALSNATKTHNGFFVVDVILTKDE